MHNPICFQNEKLVSGSQLVYFLVLLLVHLKLERGISNLQDSKILIQLELIGTCVNDTYKQLKGNTIKHDVSDRDLQSKAYVEVSESRSI